MTAKKSFGELYDPAMEVETPEEAARILEDLVSYTMEVGGVDRAEALAITKSNLGYWAGYYGAETRRKVENLFDTAHPFLGRIAETGELTPEQAFELGKAAAKRLSFPNGKSQEEKEICEP